MPEWLQRLLARAGITVPTGQTWETTFRKFAAVEEKARRIYFQLQAAAQQGPLPPVLLVGYDVMRSNIYQTQVKLRGAAIRGGVPPTSIPVPVHMPAVVQPIFRFRSSSTSGLGGVAVPMNRLSQLTHRVPGTVGTLGSATAITVAVAVAVVAVAAAVALVWWAAAAAVEDVAAVELAQRQADNVDSAVTQFIRCQTACAGEAGCLQACAGVATPAQGSPGALPTRDDEFNFDSLTRLIKGIISLTVVGGVIYGIVTVVKKVRSRR